MIEKIKNLTIIITCVSSLVGIITIGITVHNTYKQSRYSGIDHAIAIIKSEDIIQDSVAKFLRDFRDTINCREKIKHYSNGFQYYHSKEQQSYLAISHHYETAATLINANYIDFELYFQIVAFPDEFYERTAPLKKCICSNWYGEGKPLKDFLSNFENLKIKFEERRKLGE